MLARKSLVLLASQWLSMAIQLLSGVIVARMLGPAPVGRMAFYFGVIGLFMMLPNLGFAFAHIRRVAEGVKLSECVGVYTAITGGLNALTCAALAIALVFMPAEFRDAAFVLFFAYQVLINLAAVPLQTFEGRQEMAKMAVCNVGGKTVRLVVLLVLFWGEPTLVAVASAYVLEGIFTLGSAIFLLRDIVPRLQFSKPLLRSYWTYAKPLMILTPMTTLADSVDRLILGAAWTPAKLGFYSVARNLYEGMKTLPNAVLTALLPRLTNEFTGAPRERLQTTFRETYRKMLLLFTPIAVLGVNFAPLLVRVLYGPSFAPAAGPVAVFFVIMWAMSLFAPFHHLLYASERHHSFLWVRPIAMAVYLGALAFVARLPNALSLAAACQAFLWLIPAIPLFLWTRDLTGSGFLRNAIKIVLAGLVMSAPFALVWWTGGGPGWILAVTLPACALYAGAAVVLRMASREDFRRLLEALNLPHLWAYIRHETRRSPS
jgi:O-antigen/teichoic acid export membrane protein